MNNKNLRNRFKDFIYDVKSSDKVAILHHTDPDGITSAVIINKILSKQRNKEIDLRINQKPDELFITENTFKKLKQKKINKLIITDLSVDQYKDKLISKVEEFAEILILDHHKLYNDLNSKKIVHIKPQMIKKNIDPSRYSTSKLAYDLCSEIDCVEELDWIAAIGMIGDQVITKWKPFMNKVFKRYGIKNKKDVFDTTIGKVTETIFFTEAYDINKIKECYEIINHAKSFKEISKSKLNNYRKKVEKEIDYWKNNVIRFAEIYPKHEIIFDYIKPRYSIKSAISSVISNKYPNKTIIIAQDMKSDFVQLSVRRMDKKIAVNELLERALKNFKGASGGGHINSAGGRIRKKDLYRFMDSIKDIMDNRPIFRGS